jgi:hypothetical protein
MRKRVQVHARLLWYYWIDIDSGSALHILSPSRLPVSLPVH